MQTNLEGPTDILRNEDLPAIFWDALPENGGEHPDMAAIQALLEESTPEELAENFRVSLLLFHLPALLWSSILLRQEGAVLHRCKAMNN